MARGIEIQLFDGDSALANETGLELAWFDQDTVGELQEAISIKKNVSTDASGFLKLNLDNVSWLSVGDWGFLVVYKPNGGNYKLSPVFASKVQVTTVTGGIVMPNGEDWVRPAGWLPLPDISGEDAIVSTVAIFPLGKNILSFRVWSVGVAGYEVDWGDGVFIPHADGAIAGKVYSYGDIDPTTDPNISTAVACTFSDTGDLVNRVAHGYHNGTRVAFATINTTTGLAQYQGYYVVNATADTFQVSPNLNGTPNVLTNDGTGTVYVESFRQVILKIRPPVGESLAGFHGTNVDTALNDGYFYAVNYVDMWVNAPSLTVMNLHFYSSGYTANLTSFRMSASAMTSLESAFAGCRKLEIVHELVTSAAFTNLYEVFRACGTLCHVCNFDTSSVTTFFSAFYECYFLKRVPLFNTSACLSFELMFFANDSLLAIPPFDFSSATTIAWCFYGCSTLPGKITLDLPVCTSMTSAFAYCRSVKELHINTSAALINMSAFANYSYGLSKVHISDVSMVTNASSAFNACRALTDVSFGTEFNSVTNIGTMFSYSDALSRVPAINCSLVNIPTTNITNNMTCTWMDLYGITRSLNISNCKLDANAINHLFSNLGTAAGAQTVNVSSNPGAATCNTSIATAKGWSVIV